MTTGMISIYKVKARKLKKDPMLLNSCVYNELVNELVFQSLASALLSF